MSSKILVVIQFSAILIIALIGKFPESIFAIILLVSGLLLGIAAIIYMKLDNLKVLPEPKKDVRLITSGPYKTLRHPMYASVLIVTAAFIFDSPSRTLYPVWFILLGVLLAKINIEETLLPRTIPEYAEYQKHTWKLIPFIF